MNCGIWTEVETMWRLAVVACYLGECCIMESESIRHRGTFSASDVGPAGVD